MSINTPLSNPSTSLWDQLNWQPSPEQIEQFSNLQLLLKHWNNKVNLTRLTDGNDYWVSQIVDSLWPLKNKLKNQTKGYTCVDVGSGCGFPGLAVAIALPKSQITLIDSVSRKTSALEAISKELGISSRTIVFNERVEITAHRSSFRGKFDIAMARAVADAPVVAEYLIPLLNIQGEALIYRGKWSQSDQQALNVALESLKAKIKRIERIELPEKRGERHLIRITTNKTCPNKFPRSIGIPSRKPLGN